VVAVATVLIPHLRYELLHLGRRLVCLAHGDALSEVDCRHAQLLVRRVSLHTRARRVKGYTHLHQEPP
jgi:hypothetical protein